MPKYIIEREISGASTFTQRQLLEISRRSIDAIRTMGRKIQWIQSYIAEDKIYCEYIAANEELIREHARKGGFPVSHISRVHAVIDPVTAE
jgi:hypothetical protein